MPLIVHDDVEAGRRHAAPDVRAVLRRHGRARGATSTTTWPFAWATRHEAKRVQDLYLEGKKDEAAAAIPTKLVEELALIGPRDKIRHDLEAWRDSIATTLLICGTPELLRDAAELVLG